MKITLIVVDIRSPRWATEASNDYLSRFPRDWKVDLKAVKEEPRRGQTREKLMAAEAERIRKSIPKGACQAARCLAKRWGSSGFRHWRNRWNRS